MVLFRWASLAGASVKTKISDEHGAAVSASCHLYMGQERLFIKNGLEFIYIYSMCVCVWSVSMIFLTSVVLYLTPVKCLRVPWKTNTMYYYYYCYFYYSYFKNDLKWNQNVNHFSFKSKFVRFKLWFKWKVIYILIYSVVSMAGLEFHFIPNIYDISKQS